MGYPLALRLLAGYGNVPSKLLDILPDIYSKILPLDIDNDNYLNKTILDIFEHAWKAIDKKERTILAQLNVFADRINYQAAIEIVGEFNQFAQLFITKGFLDSDIEGDWYVFHPLLKILAKKKSGSSKIIKQTEQSYIDYYLDKLYKLDSDYQTSQEDKTTTFSFLNNDFTNLKHAWLLATTNHKYQAIEKSTRALESFCDNTMRLQDGYDLFSRTRSAFEKSLDANSCLAGLNASMAWMQIRFHNYLEAQTLAKAALSHEKGLNLNVEITAKNCLAVCLDQAGNFQAAKDLYKEIVELSNEKSNSQGVAFINLGINARYRGDFDNCLSHLSNAEKIFTLNQRKLMLAVTAFSKGALYIDWEQPLKALAHFQKSYDIAIQENTDHWQTMSLLGLAESSKKLRKYESAIQNCELVLKKNPPTKSPTIAFDAFTLLAEISLAQEAPISAQNFLVEAISLTTNVSQVKVLHLFLLQCDIFIHTSNLQDAIDLHRFLASKEALMKAVDVSYSKQLNTTLSKYNLPPSSQEDWTTLTVDEVVHVLRQIHNQT